MAKIIVDYSEFGNYFRKYQNSWNLNMDPGWPEGPCPAVGDVVTLTGYTVGSYAPTETASAEFHYMEEGGTGYMVEANTREGGTPIYAAGVDDAIVSGTVSFTITSVEEGDGVWMVSMVFGTPPIEEKALGGNAVTFFKEKMEGMVGDLSDLQTTDKSSAVAAINELVESGGVNVVQTVGTSTTDVMSQNAASKMVYLQPTSTVSDIQIGKSFVGSSYSGDGNVLIGNLQRNGATAITNVYIGNAIGSTNYGNLRNNGGQGNIVIGPNAGSYYSGNTAGKGAISIGMNSYTVDSYSIALGRAAQARNGGVALGAGAKSLVNGEVNIGTTDTTYGYSNSNYRLLTGLYDPVNAHDAATKGYVDNAIPTVPTNVSSFTNDANYQNASQVSSAIATAVGQITEFKFEVVQTLPATGDTSTIYLVPITGSAQNTYDEYLYVNNAWEKIGSTDIDLSNYVQFSDLATVATTGDYNDLTNLPEGMVVLEYGTSTWADFLAAYRDNRVVYCRASSGSDPSVGDKTRMAFMAYVTNPSNPTGVEFQYYRSVNTKSASNQTDQVVVYKLASNGTWTVETRNTNVKIEAGTNMTSSYSGGVLTLNATQPTVNDATLTIQKNGTNVATFTSNAASNVTANITVPTITMQTTDPGEGATLAANNFIAVYQ